MEAAADAAGAAQVSRRVTDEKILANAQAGIEEKRRKNRCACGQWKTWRECRECDGFGEQPREHGDDEIWVSLEPCAECKGFGGAMACKRCVEQQRRAG